MNNKIKTMFMIFLVLTLPLSVSGQVSSDSRDQVYNVGSEIERRLTEPPGIDDIIGEDIIINVGEYQPPILRTGTLEDQGANVYAVLKGTPSNPSITIPKINDVDIISYNVHTVPEGLPIKVGRPRYFRNQDRTISYDNMGYLVLPIARIPQESRVPEEIIVEIDSRVLFDVSSGLGASPTSMIIKEKGKGSYENQQYLNIIIEAEEISDDYAIFDIYDSNRNQIVNDLKIEEGKKSRTLRRERFYSPGQVFDKFNIYLKDIKQNSKNLDLMVIRDGIPEIQTISEGESIYPGSSIILKRISTKGDFVYAEFLAPSGRTQTAHFPLVLPESTDIDFEDIPTETLSDSAEVILCGERIISATLKAAETNLANARDATQLLNALNSVTSCTREFYKNPEVFPKESADAIQSLLAEIFTKSSENLVSDRSYESVDLLARAELNKFSNEYWNAYSSAPISQGISQINQTAEEIYQLAINEYQKIVSSYKNGDLVNYTRSPSGKTSIADFHAQYNSAVIYQTKLRNPSLAIREYKNLLTIYNNYDDEEKNIAKTIIGPEKIENRIKVLTAFLKNPEQGGLRAEIDIIEKSGELVTVAIDSSSLAQSQIDAQASNAKIRISNPSVPSKFESHELREGLPLPVASSSTVQWIVSGIEPDQITLTPSDRSLSRVKVNLDDKDGSIITLKDKERSFTQTVILDGVELHNEAHIIVSPNIEKAFSAARFNLHIPIEKRAFDLPLFSDSIESEIDKTEKLIAKLDDTLYKVGQIHEAWKKFCFGVYTSIAAWNFLKAAAGAGGGRAKDEASKMFWEENGEWCDEKGYSMDECVFARQDSYDSILERTEESFDYASQDSYEGELSAFEKDEENRVELEDLAYLQKQMLQNSSASNTEKYVTAFARYQEKSNYDFAVEKYQTGKVLTHEEEAKVRLEVANSNAEMLSDLKIKYPASQVVQELERQQASSYLPEDNQVFVGELVSKDLMRTELKSSFDQETIDNAKHVYVSPAGGLIFFDDNRVGAKSVHSPDGKEYTLSETTVVQRFEHNSIVTFYSEGPNKGKIHRMSTDALRYVEIDYTSSGRMKEPVVFQRSAPNSPIVGDSSESMVGTGGLREVISTDRDEGRDTSNLNKVESCVGSFNKAKASNRDRVICNGISYAVKKDAVLKGPACVNFYSPGECKLLFNACDPVLCPSSRFDLNGVWRVDNVVETGIIGSTILGLHNFGIPGTGIGTEAGSVVMPVCITGIYAGLKNIQTVLMEYSDCLKRSLVDDESVGICDMIRSYYICDVLWKEAIAIFNIKSGVVGSILKKIHNDEGSEYSDFSASMDQTINGLKYFTQDYAKNTFAQFSGGALPEIGGEICKAAVFGKVPGVGSFTDRLLQPESPPQFTAIMDTVPYSDIPFPPQSTYQVYYRMYAGANEPISFSVYLRYQGLEPNSHMPAVWLVRNKRLNPDQFDAETIDFTAQDGYNQVCVAYTSPTYGTQEECGFGKTSTGFGLEYLSNKVAQLDSQERGITTAEECNPSGSSLTTPYSSVAGKTASLAVGGFASGLTETGITRVCSSYAPGDEADWQPVGECWEEEGEKGRYLGACWMHMPSAKNIVAEHAVNQEAYWEEVQGEAPTLSSDIVQSINEYAKNIGIRTLYITPEDINNALEKINKAKSESRYSDAADVYADLIDNGLFTEEARTIELRFELAELYETWALSLERNKAMQEQSKASEGSGQSTEERADTQVRSEKVWSEVVVGDKIAGITSPERYYTVLELLDTGKSDLVYLVLEKEDGTNFTIYNPAQSTLSSSSWMLVNQDEFAEHRRILESYEEYLSQLTDLNDALDSLNSELESFVGVQDYLDAEEYFYTAIGELNDIRTEFPNDGVFRKLLYDVEFSAREYSSKAEIIKSDVPLEDYKNLQDMLNFAVTESSNLRNGIYRYEFPLEEDQLHGSVSMFLDDLLDKFNMVDVILKIRSGL